MNSPLHTTAVLSAVTALFNPVVEAAATTLSQAPTSRHHGPFAVEDVLELRRGWGYELLDGEIVEVYLHYSLINRGDIELSGPVFYDPAFTREPLALELPACVPASTLEWRSPALDARTIVDGPAALRLTGPIDREYLRSAPLERGPAASTAVLARRFAVGSISTTGRLQVIEYHFDGWSILRLSRFNGAELLIMRPAVALTPRSGETASMLARRAINHWLPTVSTTEDHWVATLADRDGHLFITTLNGDTHYRRLHLFVTTDEPLVLAFIDDGNPAEPPSAAFRALGGLAEQLLQPDSEP